MNGEERYQAGIRLLALWVLDILGRQVEIGHVASTSIVQQKPNPVTSSKEYER